MSKYYSIHEFSKIIGVSAQTLRNWDANGKLHPHHTTVSGYRYYSEQQELVEDLVQIITVFSCKLQGKRAKITVSIWIVTWERRLRICAIFLI